MRLMLTSRKVFSKTLDSSATSVRDTGTTVSQTSPNRAAARRVHSSVRPPTTFGVFDRFQPLVLAGSTRSGAIATWKSVPGSRPVVRARAAAAAAVVPGGTVDCRISSIPRRSSGATESIAACT